MASAGTTACDKSSSPSLRPVRFWAESAVVNSMESAMEAAERIAAGILLVQDFAELARGIFRQIQAEETTGLDRLFQHSAFLTVLTRKRQVLQISDIAHAALNRWLFKRGLSTTDRTVQTHRQGKCRCDG